MKKFILIITLLFFIFPFKCFSGGPICGGPIGIGGIDIATPGTISEFQLDHNTETLSGDKTLIITDRPIHFLDSNGADRNIILPAEAFSTDLVFTIINVSDGAGEDLVIRDDTPTTLKTIGPGQGERVSCDGTNWMIWFDNGIKFDVVANSTIFPSENDPVTPTVAFGDGDTGFYEYIDDVLFFAVAGAYCFGVSSTQMYYPAGSYFAIQLESTSATNPIYSFNSDSDTGIGAAAVDQLSLIAGGVEGVRISEATTTETEILGRAVLNDTTFAFATEADITDPLAGSVYLLDGDNDSENDTISLKDGETAGQILYLIAAADIDADDTCTIGMTLTTCTNCPAIVFNKVGENAHLIWTGSTWVVISLQDAL